MFDDNKRHIFNINNQIAGEAEYYMQCWFMARK